VIDDHLSPEDRQRADDVTTIHFPAVRPASGNCAAPLPLVWFDRIAPSLEVMDFVQGVLIEKCAVVVYGDSNGGKTFWASDLALHVAAGRRWNGRRVEQGGVVYCVLEGSKGFRNRVTAWKRKHGLEDTTIPFAVVEVPLDLLEPRADTARLIATVQAAAARKGMPVKLVVIDTLSRALAGGNENSSEDMGALVRNMDTIRAETGACVLFIHHTGKDQARGARGWSGLRAAIDTEIEVVADEDAATARATVVKQRDMQKGDAFAFRLERVVLGQNRHGEDVTTCVVEPMGEGARRPARMPPPQLKKALGFLHDLVAREGVPLPAAWCMAPDLRGVREDRWREESESRRLSTSPDPRNRRSVITRAMDGLNNGGLVAMKDGWVWAVHPPAGRDYAERSQPESKPENPK
jgi:hypothetical protein